MDTRILPSSPAHRLDDTVVRRVRPLARRFALEGDPVERESTLSSYLEQFVDRDGGAAHHVLSRPLDSAAAMIAILRLPRLAAALGQSREARAIELGLSRSIRGRTVLHSVTAVLAIPADPDAYREGSSKQTLRRKTRAGTKVGITWRPVDDQEERRYLLRLAHDQERTHPQDAYRIEDPANFDLLDYRLWLVAYSAQGCPLLIAVAPVDGEWALLRYFRTLGGGQEHSDARYLMTDVLVGELARLGVRYLADSKSPFNLTNGLRHFQRMLGFRMVRVDIVRDPAGEWTG